MSTSPLPPSASNVQIVICENADALARRAAELWIQAAEETLAHGETFSVMLSGGSTPEKLYLLMSSTEESFRQRADWKHTRLFFGDERAVPHDDEKQSNFALAQRTLSGPLGDLLPPANMFPIPVSSAENADEAARAYEKILREQFLGMSRPAFDLVLLGLGDDGHTASLFPGKPALEEQTRLVIATPPGVLPPPVDRVTLTFPVLNAAHRVLFLVAGAGKAEAVQAVLGTQPESVDMRPATGIKTEKGTVTWLLDRAAAGQ